MIELRWAVPEGTSTQAPRLQYRLRLQIGLGRWGEWEDVPTVVVAQEPPQPAPTALVAPLGVDGKSPEQLRKELLSGQWDLSKAAEKPAGVPAEDATQRLRAALQRVRDGIASDRCDGDTEYALGVNAACANHVKLVERVMADVAGVMGPDLRDLVESLEAAAISYGGSSISYESQARAKLKAARDAVDAALGVTAAPAPSIDPTNQFIGDLMILQVLADSEQVNEQEREVLMRWIELAQPPGVSGTVGETFPHQTPMEDTSSGKTVGEG